MDARCQRVLEQLCHRERWGPGWVHDMHSRGREGGDNETGLYGWSLAINEILEAVNLILVVVDLVP